MALFRSIATIGSWTMMSRILGFVRDVAIAALLGAGPAADAFVVAFRLPNLFRRLFAEGAMNAALVPVYAEVLERDGRDAAKRFAGEATSLLLLAMLSITVLAMAFMPWVVIALAPGFAGDEGLLTLTVTLSTLTFPYLLFMALTALLGGVLNTMGRFGAVAAAPVILNVILIGALGAGHFGLIPTAPAHSLAWGVAAAGIAQFVLVAYSCHRAGVLPRLPLPSLTKNIRKLLRLMAPGVLGAGVVQINLVIGTQLASLLPLGAIAHIYYADRVAQLPLGVVGVAIGVALLPLLSRQLQAGELRVADHSFNRAMEASLLLTLPATAALIAIPEPIADVLFRRGAFDQADSEATALVIRAMALGLPAAVLSKTLAPAYFARQDTRTPVRLAVVAVVVNIVLALLLMQVLGASGIALAASLAALVNVKLMAIILYRRGHLTIDARLNRAAPRILAAAAVMGFALWGIVQFFPDWVAWGVGSRVGLLAALVTAGGVLYFGSAHAIGATDLRAIRQLLRPKRQPNEPRGAQDDL